MASSESPDHRRKWALLEEKDGGKEVEEKQEDDGGKKVEEKQEDNGGEKEKKELKPPQYRDFKLDFDRGVGRRVIIKKNALGETSGYHCLVCDCVMKDSLTYFDHINGWKHQANLGKSMEVERSTLEQVKQRFEVNKEKLRAGQRMQDLTKLIQELGEQTAKKMEEQRKRERIELKRKRELAFETLANAIPPGPEEPEELDYARLCLREGIDGGPIQFKKRRI